MFCMRCGFDSARCCCPEYFTRGSWVEETTPEQRRAERVAKIKRSLEGAYRAMKNYGPGLARAAAEQAALILEAELAALEQKEV